MNHLHIFISVNTPQINLQLYIFHPVTCSFLIIHFKKEFFICRILKLAQRAEAIKQ